MQACRTLIKSKPTSIGYGYRCLHSTAALQKFVTDTELVHRSVKYGYNAYPSRPNDPRVPSNLDFGVTLLDKDPTIQTDSKGKISKAMEVYLERAAKHQEFMSKEQEDFDLGKRYLSHIMGVNEEKMTQDNINKAIKYLMPSGLFDRRARPRMLPPDKIFPAIKEAQFNPNGRPFHPFFYTGRPSFYQISYEIEEQLRKLNEVEAGEFKKGIPIVSKLNQVDLTTSTWLDIMEMKRILLEKLSEERYQAFINAMERLANHPYSVHAKDFIMKYRKPVVSAIENMMIKPLRYDKDNRPFSVAKGRRKYCIAEVIVRGQGTGKVDINGQDILYFDSIQDREQIMTPINFVGLLGKVDIECRTMYEEQSKEWSEDAPAFPPNQPQRILGTSSQSGAIRYALSVALKSFVDEETIRKMHAVGLLTRDARTKERKKWGQEGARRKYTWKRR